MKTRRFRMVLAALSLCGIVSSGVAAEERVAAPAPAIPQMQALQEKILNDEGAMALIGALSENPEVQALLSDPKVLQAIESGDLGQLLNDSRVLKLMNNPEVKEIGRKLDTKLSGGGT